MLSTTKTMYMLNRVSSAVTFRALKIVDSYMFQCLELKDTIIISLFYFYEIWPEGHLGRPNNFIDFKRHDMVDVLSGWNVWLTILMWSARHYISRVWWPSNHSVFEECLCRTIINPAILETIKLSDLERLFLHGPMAPQKKMSMSHKIKWMGH
jgi:hypothetical protein